MTIHKDYIAGKATDLFLDFYAKRPEDGRGEDILYRRVVDQEAYDTWHLSWYFKEILEIHQLLKQERIAFADIPRKEKNVLVYSLLDAWGGPADLMEFGCSLFELVDGLELVRKWAAANANAADVVSRTRFFGVELAEVMRLGAERLHPGVPFQFFRTLSDVDRSFDIVYDRNVSSYALSDPNDLLKLINGCSVSFHNLFVSRGKTFLSMRMGKSLTYFGLNELLAGLNRPLFHLFGRSSRGTSTSTFDASLGHDVVEGFFLCADESFARRWLDAAKRHPEIAAWMRDKDIALTPAECLW